MAPKAIAIALVVLVGAVSIGGVVLRMCVRWIDGFTPTWRRSCLAVVLAVLVTLLFGYLLQLFPDVAGRLAAGQVVATILAFVVRTTIVAGSVHLLIHRPDGSSIGYPRAFAIAAAAVAIAMTLLWIVLRGLAVTTGYASGLP